MNIPIDAAKEISKKFNQDQVIILTWSKKSGDTHVVTYGEGDTNSIQAANGGNQIKDFLKFQRDHDDIPERFKEWKVIETDRYWFWSGRNKKDFVEITYLYEVHTSETKDKIRKASCFRGNEFELPNWTASCQYRESKNIR